MNTFFFPSNSKPTAPSEANFPLAHTQTVFTPTKLKAQSHSGERKMSEYEGSTLRLSVEKGPLSGRFQEFKPGTRIQIGRVRGNTLIIKDAGVSSKHLTLQFDSGSGKWTLTDLNSSNGTFLNSVLLEPTVPYPLSDGDVIKIGELTAIEVKVNQNVKDEEKREEDSRPRRNPRRQAGIAVADKQLGVIDENRELGLGVDESVGERNAGGKGGRRRGRPPKNEVKKSGEQGEELENFEGNVVRRTTRSSRRAQNLGNDEEIGNLPVGKVILRRTRSSKKEYDLENCKESGIGIGGKVSSSRTESSKEVENFEEDSKGTRNEVVARVSLRRTRSVKPEEMFENGREDVAPVVEKKGQVMKLRITRSSTRRAANLEETQSEGAEVVDLNVVEGRRTRKDLTKRNLVVEALESVENAGLREGKTVDKLNLGEGCEVESGNISTAETDRVEKKDENLGREGVDGMVGRSGVKESSVLVDLEKMTLGEWFDYLEEHLPKQIIDKTEDMILGMRQKAEKFHEFMLQLKVPEEKDEIPIG